MPTRDELIVERIRGRGRGRDRQDQRAGVGGGLAHVQPDLRHHPQPLRPEPVRRRVQRGSGRRAGGGHGAARRRQRHGRFAAQPGVVLQRRRACGPASAGCPAWPTTNAWELTSVGGPMARNVEDLALLLSVIAGPSTRARCPWRPPARPSPAARRRPRRRCGWRCRSTSAAPSRSTSRSPRIVAPRARSSPAAGAQVDEDHPDAHRRRGGLPHPARLAVLAPVRRDARAAARRRSSSRWPTTSGRRDLTGADVATAYQRLTSLAEKMRAVLRELRRAGAAGQPGAAVRRRRRSTPRRSTASEQATYLDWMRSAYLITVTGCPAISVPAGFTREGWPVGIQIVAAPGTSGGCSRSRTPSSS